MAAGRLWRAPATAPPQRSKGSDGAEGGAQRRPERSLGRYANSSSGGGRVVADQAVRRRAKRRRRVELRDRMRSFTRLGRVQACGAVTVTGAGGPTVRVSDTGGGRVAGYAGLATCGSVWACPVCAAKVASERAQELREVLGAVLAAGGSASLMTFTMRHSRADRLADCWDAVSAAWARVTSGRTWVADQERGGMLGWARVVEVTDGVNGWHVHVHVLVCWDRPVSGAFAEYVGTRMWGRWARALGRRGFESLVLADDFDELRGGLNVRMASLDDDGLADYFTKLAFEVTGGHAKEGRAGGRSPFEILAGAVEGVADDVERWWEWEAGSRDRRQLTWSGGDRDLREWAGLGRQQSDEEIAAAELGGDDTLAIPAESWQVMRGSRLAVELLEVLEVAGLQGGRAWLERRGLAASVVAGRPRLAPLPRGECPTVVP